MGCLGLFKKVERSLFGRKWSMPARSTISLIEVRLPSQTISLIDRSSPNKVDSPVYVSMTILRLGESKPQ